jgi:hypothetical protein
MKGWYRESVRHSLAAKGLTRKRSFAPVDDLNYDIYPQVVEEQPIVVEEPEVMYVQRRRVRKHKPAEKSILKPDIARIKKETKGPYKKFDVSWWSGQGSTLFDKTATNSIKNWKWIRFP